MGSNQNSFIEKINGAIEGVLNRFLDDEGDYKRYLYNDSVRFGVEEEISTLLCAFGLQNSVELVVAFVNPNITCYVLCISYVVDGILETYNVDVYED